MIPVSTAPAIIPRTGLLKMSRIRPNSGISASGLTAEDIALIPYMSIAKPTSIEPISRFLPFLHIMIMTTPMSAITGEKDSGLSIRMMTESPCMPERESIHAVTVVPTFAPMMTPTA